MESTEDEEEVLKTAGCKERTGIRQGRGRFFVKSQEGETERGQRRGQAYRSQCKIRSVSGRRRTTSETAERTSRTKELGRSKPQEREYGRRTPHGKVAQEEDGRWEHAGDEKAGRKQKLESEGNFGSGEVRPQSICSRTAPLEQRRAARR